MTSGGNPFHTIDIEGTITDGQDASSQTLTPTQPTPRGHRVRGGANASLKWARERAAEALVKQQSEREAMVLQQVLPLWNDEHRGVPNPMIRSGLFSTKVSKTREFIKDQTVASLSNFSIVYKGEELRQDDLSVWMALLNMASAQAIGDAIFFSGYQLVKDLGWTMHSDSYRRAKESISRLKANELKIQVNTGTASYSGSLIREYAWAALGPDGNERWMVRFEPRIADLFRDDSVTFIAWQQRCAIGAKSPLALWLHSYYTSHKEPFPHSIAKLHELCKSEQKEMRLFKRRLIVALDKLVAIGFLTGYTIRAGNDVSSSMVEVKRAPVRLPSLRSAVVHRLAR